MAEKTERKPIPAEKKKKMKEEEVKSSIKKYRSFREESNIVADLEDYQKRALDEFKSLLHSALLDTDQFFQTPTAESPPKPLPPQQITKKKNKNEEEEEEEEEKVEASPSHGEINPTTDEDGAKTVQAIGSTVATSEEEEKKKGNGISIWGVPLLEEGDSRSDTVLLKFLRAREFKAKDAMVMIKNTILWRRDFGIDDLLLLLQEEEGGLGVIPEFDKVVFVDGVDKLGHPVCYNVYGGGGEMVEEEERKRFLRWRILFLEKGIRELLDFSPGGVSTMVQVTDFRNYSPALLLKAELRHALYLLQDNYPEFVAKQIFINVPWWYIALKKMMSPFLTQRSKSKFVFAGPSESKSAETLFNYIAPEQVPVQFGGLMSKDAEFTTADAVHEINVKPSAKQIIEIPVAEKCILSWELRVVGWEVDLGAEFVPNKVDGYTVIIEKKKKKKLGASDDELVSKNSFKVSEPGKVLLTIDNTCSSKKKKILYRCKARCSS